MEKGDTGRKEAIGGKAGHGSEQTVRTPKKKPFPKQRKVAPVQKSALLCPPYETEVLQASHTSLLVTNDSRREQGCFSTLFILTIGLDLLLALPFLGERQGGGRGLVLQAEDWGSRASFLGGEVVAARQQASRGWQI